MSSVKTLPLGHISSPMYVVMDGSHGLKKSVHHWAAHDGNAQYKRPSHGGSGGGHHSPPLTGTRGYPYPQDPTRCSTSSTSYVSSAVSSSPHLVHPGGGGAIYASANHMYRDGHFQVDTRQPTESHHIERYGDHHVQNARRRLSLRPPSTPEYTAALDRERYMDAIRYHQYEREVSYNVPYSPNAMTVRNLKPPVVSVHTPSEMDNVQPMKRPRLAVEPKAPVHQPLLIDTRNVVIKKEPAYTPQVEAISPTLPSEEGRCESPMRVMKENILNNINRVDKEINQLESTLSKLHKKMVDLELEASKPAVSKEIVKDVCPVESKQMSMAQIIYSENRGKALDSHTILEKLGPKVEIPMYNQPSDTAVYHENKRKFHFFRTRLVKCFKKRHRERSMRESHLTESYSKLMQDWLKKMEKKDNNSTKKAKDAKLREFFEKQFPELKKQREDKERISRVSTRIRSESEWEEIIDGLAEQENEEKKMRSYAVIPPIILDPRQRNMCFLNNNGFVEDLSQEYKDKQMLHVWTDQEKDIFREKYLQHPKNFALIASCLERKTVAACVQYYYHSKKGENYKQLLRKHSVRKRTRALGKPPQNQQPQVSQATGVTTRQQEDARGTSTSCGTLPTNYETTTQAPTDNGMNNSSTIATTSATVTNCSPVSTSCSVTTTVGTDATTPSGLEISLAENLSNKPDTGKNLLPNNIRKKKEAALQMGEKEETRSDSDTASDQQNDANPAQPCAVCKMELDNYNQSRALTKSNCSMFGIKEGDLAAGMRVCASCRFKSVRKRCPIPTCKTPKKKVKRLRPLPGKLAELPAEAKEAIISELQIPSDVSKCCSACFNRIVRKLENNSGDSEMCDNSNWTDYEMDLIKQGLIQHGTDWESVSSVVSTKTKPQCKSFFFSYKHKLGLDVIVHEFKKAKRYKEGMQQDGKPPPIVTDEEESGETTSSCDEDDRADRCSSDTASAPSPVNKIISEDKIENQLSQDPAEPIPNSLPPSDEPRSRTQSHLDASPKGNPDYDSSATMSADEGQTEGGNSSSPRVIHQGNHSAMKMPMGNELPRKAFQHPMPVSKEIESRTLDPSVPLVKTLLQDPKIGAAITDDSAPYIQPSKPGKEEPTCVRDLIYQAIEMSLGKAEWPNKVGRNNSPIPSSIPMGLKTESPDITIVEPKKEGDGSLIPPTAHGGSRHPSRPNSHHMEVQPDCEVQDLSKKVKSRDVSPVRDFQKRERVVTPVRPPSGSNSSASHIHYYGAPPPAHCNQYRTSQPPPPALSPHYVAEPHHETTYPRYTDPRGKTYIPSERPHSQPPHLVAQSSSITGGPNGPLHAKPIPIKATVPPPPPLVASKPSQMSPKMPFKDRLVSLPPTGSITQGTPVNQQSIAVPPTNLSSPRYEGFLRQLPPPQTKDGGSITLGTPVQHDSVKRVPTNRPEAFSQNLPDGMVRQAVPAMYDPSVMEYYRQVAPGGQQYAFAPSYQPYPNNVPPQRPPYANESQLSSKQIMIDFNTSKQMLRRGGGGIPEKEIKASPRSADSTPTQAPQENHLHPMYPPANYQGSSGTHYNHVPAGYQQDSRYMHHRPPSTPMDRTRSPSGAESPLSAGYATHPGKRSPSLALASGRQNVIHRSITWGTGKPSVIQAPQSASPRTSDMRTETVSPASIRKSTPSPRHPQPILYPSVPPSGHDAFNTLVNAAVAQPSLVVPKDGKGSPNTNVHSRQEVRSPRDRPVVEGLEKTLIDMHQRPRSYTDSVHSLAAHERGRNSEPSPSEQQLNDRYSNSMHNSYDLSRDQRMVDKQQMLVNDQPSTLRLGNMRETFSKEQFERQLRQNNASVPRERAYSKKEEERCRSGSSESQPNYPSPSPQQTDLDNEASKIFSQSFQKDAPRSNSSPRGFTAANLIDAIITRQINQNQEAPNVPKSSGMDIFNQYHGNYEDNKTPPKTGYSKVNNRTEVVTIDDEPENEKASSWNERGNSHGRSPPVTSNNSMATPYPSDKVYTLSEHIAAIISKDYNNPSDSTQSQPLFSNSHSSANTSVSTSSRSSYVVGVSNSHNPAIGKPLEGIASALPPEAVLVNSNITHGVPDHSPQNCPGNGCSYHTHSWKLRRALQQDRDREHRSPGLNESVHKRPSSNQSSDVPQEERQIIRVAQTSSPSAASSTRTSPTGPYGVEPISPPSQPSENENNRNSSSNHNAGLTHPPPVWAGNPNFTGLLTTRHIFPQDYPEDVPPPSMTHYGVPNSAGPSSVGPNRPPHQQQMGLSPLDYVKNRIVEVMRTATDTEPEISESRRPPSAMSHSDEREHQLQQHYRFQSGADRESSIERPGSTGNAPPLLQGQRYSPAVTRYSPVPPRPSSAVERVPSRNSTPGDLPRQHKRGPDGHLIAGEWRDGQSVSSRASSRSVSPSADHPDNVNRKKTRSEGTFIPESTTDRAPVLLPQNSISIHRSGSMSEAPRLSSSNQGAQILDSQSASKGGTMSRAETYQTEGDCYKFRGNENRPESQWNMVSNHNRTSDNEPLARLSEPMNIGAASSTTVEPFSPSNRTDKSDTGTRQSPVTSSGSGSQEPSRSSPSTPSQGQRSASSTPLGMGVSSSSGLYSPFGGPNGSVSSSTNAMFSSATSLPPPVNPHVAYSSFSGMGPTYAYPFSALSMRSMTASTTPGSTPITNSLSSVSSSHVSSMPVNSSTRNSPSPRLRNNNQPPPLLSSQYEPLSDED